MKILVANPPALIPLEDGTEKYFIRAGSRWPFSVVKKRHEPLTQYIPFPFYLAYTTALLLQEGHQVDAVDAVALNWDHQRFVQFAIEKAPELLLIETSTPTVEMDIEQIKEIIPPVAVSQPPLPASDPVVEERVLSVDWGTHIDLNTTILNTPATKAPRPGGGGRGGDIHHVEFQML